MPHIKIGTMIYHESRYWKTDDLVAGEVRGWNARYLPYVVTRLTEKRIYATGCSPTGEASHVQLPRGERPKREGRARLTTLEIDGEQYHSRFHEYFYREIPKAQPKQPPRPMSNHAHALLLLGLAPPYTDQDVKQAYKRLARTAHPDAGGSHEQFIKLQTAYDTALRGY
jgi:hypothetical protein